MKSLSIVICITFIFGMVLNAFSNSPTLVINNPIAVCEPATVDITSNEITKGSPSNLKFTYWKNAAATMPCKNPKKLANGTYYIKATDSTGNFTIGAVTVIINPVVKPEVSIISTENTICNGTQVTFSAQLKNASSAKYQWKNGVQIIEAATDSFYMCNDLKNGSAINVLVVAENECTRNIQLTSNSIIMNVSPAVLPSIEINILENTICSGITFASIINNGGSAATYQWLINNKNIVGATGSTYTAQNLIEGDLVSCQLTSNALCASPVTVESNAIVVSLNAPTTHWLGINNNFNDEANWSNGAPNSNLTAIIDSNSIYSPEISSLSSVYNLVINDGAKLSINGSNTLAIYGSFTNNGLLNSNNSLIIFKGCEGTGQLVHEINTNTKAITTFYDLTLNDAAGLDLKSNAALLGSLKLMSGTFNNKQHNFTLLSTKETTAYIAPVDASASYNGKINMQCIIAGSKKGWMELGSPLNVDLIDENKNNIISNQIDNAAFENNVFKINTLNQNSINKIDTSSITKKINVGEGYLRYFENAADTADINLELSGTPTIGNFNFIPTFSQVKNNIKGFNFFANPYPSNIDWNSPSWSKLNLNDAIYTYQNKSEQYGAYVNGVGVNGASPYIDAMQGFYVQANDENPVLIASEKVKTNKAASEIEDENNNFTDPLIRFNLVGDNYTDEAVIRFNEASSKLFDKNFDAFKMQSLNQKTPSICSVTDNNDLSINTVPFENNLSIPIKVNIKSIGKYTINFDVINTFDNILCLVFEDLNSNIKTDISNSKSYQFIVNDLNFQPQFMLHVAAPLNITATDVNGFNAMDGTINIKEGNKNWTYALYNDLDSIIKAGNVTKDNFIISNLQAGNFIIQLSNNMGCYNMIKPIVIGTDTTVISFQNNNTIFMDRGEALINLTDTTANGSSYLWDFGDGTIIGTITPSAAHSYTKEGRYEVTMTSTKDENKIVKNISLDVFKNLNRHSNMDIQNINGEYYAVFKFDKSTQVALQVEDKNGQIVAAPQVYEGLVGSQKIELPNTAKIINMVCLTDGKNKMTKRIA